MKKYHRLLASTFLASIAVAENGKGWKLDAEGKVELQNGNPVMIGEDGKELAVAPDTVTRYLNDAKVNKAAREAAEAKLKTFEGITDPAAALKAIENMSKIDQKKLIDAGEVDKVRAEVAAQYTGQLTEKDKLLNAANSRIDDMTLDSAFASSEFIRDQIAIPPDMFRASVRNNFKVKEGKIVPYDRAGNELMSETNYNEHASFDEALTRWVTTHPQKDTILKAENVPQGTGGGGNGGARGGNRVMKRSDWAAKPPHVQSQLAEAQAKGELKIID